MTGANMNKRVDQDDQQEVEVLEQEAQEDVIIETEEEQVEETEADEGEEASAAEGDESDQEGLIVTIGDDPPASEDEEEARAPSWVRDLRKQFRDEKKRSRELQQELDQLKGATAPRPTELPKKPTLESVDYDTDKFEKELEAWHEKKRKHDERVSAAKAEQESIQQDWQKKLESYQSAKSGMKVRDYDDAEMFVQDTFNVTQQGVMIQGAENPALLVYALGKNHTRAKELASIKDPVKFAFAVAKLETQLKVTDRKAKPQPEKAVTGTGRMSGTVDSTLERLRAEASKTGDYSKVFQYKKQKKAN
jgi:hypothetical protein